MVLTNLLLIGLGVLIVVFILIVSTQVFKLIFEYQIADDEIIVLLFHLAPIYRIPLRTVETLYEAPAYQVALIPGMHLFTRPFGRRVVVEMRGRWARFAFLTPTNPAAFIADIKRRMKRA
jgi:hypothetical protein